MKGVEHMQKRNVHTEFQFSKNNKGDKNHERNE